MPGGWNPKSSEPIIVDSICVKGDTLLSEGRAIDWTYMQIADWDSTDSSHWAGAYDVMLEQGISWPANQDYGRDGCFSDSDTFLVFERADLLALRAVVDAAVAVAGA